MAPIVSAAIGTNEYDWIFLLLLLLSYQKYTMIKQRTNCIKSVQSAEIISLISEKKNIEEINLMCWELEMPTHSHELAFQVPSTSVDYIKFSFFPRTARDWNLLPSDVMKALSHLF